MTSIVNRTWLVVGLGNPGPQYEDTRHNTGFMVIDRLSEIYGINLGRVKFNALAGKGKIVSVPVILAKPQAFMNNSGSPVQQLSAWYRIDPANILVIHDDIDLEFGRIKIKFNGGHGGHNGLKSIIKALATCGFPRIRIGIGRPPAMMTVTDFVLSGFTTEQKDKIDAAIATAAEAVETILLEGVPAGMNKFNRKEL